MAIEDILLRSTSHPVLTTKGSELTFGEGDNNWIEIYEALAGILDASNVAPYNPATTYTGTTYVTYGGNLWVHVTSSSSGVTPGTNPAVWSLTSVGALSHAQNTDTYLAYGTANEVSASAIKAFFNDQYVTGTRLTILGLRNTNALKPGWLYYLSDLRISLQATSINTLSSTGNYIAYNADYHNVSAGMLSVSGDSVWGDSTSYWWTQALIQYPTAGARIGKHAIYRGRHYRNLTGANSPTLTPDTDATNWIEATTGHSTYRRAVDMVVYDIDANLIMQRHDKANNVVSRVAGITDPLEYRWQFGNDNVVNNLILGNADIWSNRGVVKSNYVAPVGYLEVVNNGANGTLAGAEISGNSLVGSNFIINDNENYISYNYLYWSSVGINGNTSPTGFVVSNQFVHVSGCTFTTNDGVFERNQYSHLNSVELGVTGLPGNAWYDSKYDGDFDLGGSTGGASFRAIKNLSGFDNALTINDSDLDLNLRFRDNALVSVGGTNTANIETITGSQYFKVIRLAPKAGSTLVIRAGLDNIVSLNGVPADYTLIGNDGDYILGTYTDSGQFDIIKVAQP